MLATCAAREHAPQAHDPDQGTEDRHEPLVGPEGAPVQDADRHGDHAGVHRGVTARAQRHHEPQRRQDARGEPPTASLAEEHRVQGEAVGREPGQRPAAGVDRGEDEPAERDQHRDERQHHQPSHGGRGDQGDAPEEQGGQRRRWRSAWRGSTPGYCRGSAGASLGRSRPGRCRCRWPRSWRSSPREGTLARAGLGGDEGEAVGGCRPAPAAPRRARRSSRTHRPPGRCSVDVDEVASTHQMVAWW